MSLLGPKFHHICGEYEGTNRQAVWKFVTLASETNPLAKCEQFGEAWAWKPPAHLEFAFLLFALKYLLNEVNKLESGALNFIEAMRSWLNVEQEKKWHPINMSVRAVHSEWWNCLADLNSAKIILDAPVEVRSSLHTISGMKQTLRFARVVGPVAVKITGSSLDWCQKLEDLLPALYDACCTVKSTMDLFPTEVEVTDVFAPKREKKVPSDNLMRQIGQAWMKQLAVTVDPQSIWEHWPNVSDPDWSRQFDKMSNPVIDISSGFPSRKFLWSFHLKSTTIGWIPSILQKRFGEHCVMPNDPPIPFRI
jgi:hypothetical protein